MKVNVTTKKRIDVVTAIFEKGIVRLSITATTTVPATEIDVINILVEAEEDLRMTHVTGATNTIATVGRIVIAAEIERKRRISIRIVAIKDLHLGTGRENQVLKRAEGDHAREASLRSSIISHRIRFCHLSKFLHRPQLELFPSLSH